MGIKMENLAFRRIPKGVAELALDSALLSVFCLLFMHDV
jgi:hypothetical protein